MIRGGISQALERRWFVAAMAGSVVLAAAILAVIVFGFNGFGDRNDFLYESWWSYFSIYHGEWHQAWHQAPAYLGAWAWRLPIALLAITLGVGWRGTFYLTAVPCLAAFPLFGAWFAWSRQSRTALGWRRVALAFAAFAVLDPVVWYAGLLGHPEEMVGICLVAAAMIVAARGQLVLALVLVAIGVLNKPGLGEVAPAVFAVWPGDRRVRRAALAICLVVVAGYVVTSIPRVAHDLNLPFSHEDTVTGGGFYPFELMWWFGRGSWPVRYAHLLIPLLGVVVALCWSELVAPRLGGDAGAGVAAPAGGGSDRSREALWLMALLVLMRTALEPWDNVYYNLPLIFTLFCLEVESGGWPWMATAATAGALFLVPTNRIIPIGPNAQAVLYAVVAVPVLVALAARCFRPVLRRARRVIYA